MKRGMEKHCITQATCEGILLPCTCTLCFTEKKVQLSVIVALSVTLRFLPSSALSGDQGRFTTVNSCLYENYSQDFSESVLLRLPCNPRGRGLAGLCSWAFSLPSSKVFYQWAEKMLNGWTCICLVFCLFVLNVSVCFDNEGFQVGKKRNNKTNNNKNQTSCFLHILITKLRKQKNKCFQHCERLKWTE